MKINIWNRDRKGGHQVSLVFDNDGIAGSTPVSRKVVKQLTGRKLRRAANKATKQADATYQEDLDWEDVFGGWWDDDVGYFKSFLDESDDKAEPDYDDSYDPWESDDYFDDLFDPIRYRMDHKETEVIDLHTGNIIGVFSNPSDATKFINDNTDRPLQVSRISGYGSHFSCFD